MRIAGVLLNALGVLAMMFGRISYKTTDTVVEVGPFKATAQHDKSIELPPFVGPVAIGAGTLLLLLGGRRKRA
jgi:hypothetical protein